MGIQNVDPSLQGTMSLFSLDSDPGEEALIGMGQFLWCLLGTFFVNNAFPNFLRTVVLRPLLGMPCGEGRPAKHTGSLAHAYHLSPREQVGNGVTCGPLNPKPHPNPRSKDSFSRDGLLAV